MAVGFVICITSGIVLGNAEAKEQKIAEEERVKNAGIAFKSDDQFVQATSSGTAIN